VFRWNASLLGEDAFRKIQPLVDVLQRGTDIATHGPELCRDLLPESSELVGQLIVLSSTAHTATQFCRQPADVSQQQERG
jgi:hypothetical protein